MRHETYVVYFEKLPQTFLWKAYGKPRNSKYSLKGTEFEQERQMVFAMERYTDFAIENPRGSTVSAYM
jgi:hypothetical protein